MTVQGQDHLAADRVAARAHPRRDRPLRGTYLGPLVTSSMKPTIRAVDQRKTSFRQGFPDTRVEHVHHFQQCALVHKPVGPTGRGGLGDDDIRRQACATLQGLRQASLSQRGGSACLPGKPPRAMEAHANQIHRVQPWQSLL